MIYFHKALFNEERIPEATTRDQIRRDVIQSFASITVWLFDAPTESTKLLKTKLSYDVTSNTFKTQLGKLRRSLVSQLREPTLFAGKELTGHNMGLLVKQVAHSLNNGELVMPSSAYAGMVRMKQYDF